MSFPEHEVLTHRDNICARRVRRRQTRRGIFPLLADDVQEGYLAFQRLQVGTAVEIRTELIGNAATVFGVMLVMFSIQAILDSIRKEIGGAAGIAIMT